MQSWQCLVCGSPGEPQPAVREGMACGTCHSTWRIRAVALLVLQGLKLPVTPLRTSAPDFSRHGLGISDNAFLAAELAGRFDYVNSYLHRFPRLDISEVPDELHGEFEFVICSDVLEHVPPPAEPSLEGLASLLRPGGFAVVSVPLTRRFAEAALPPAGANTVEYYPGLTSYDEVGDTVIWTDSVGVKRTDVEPEFHGGQGRTLAFRLWGMDDLVARFGACGLAAEAHGDDLDAPEFGVPALPFSGLALLRRTSTG